MWLARLFRQGTGDKTDYDAIAYVKEQLIQILSYFTDDNEHTMRGMSLFVVVDSEKKSYNATSKDVLRNTLRGETQ